MSYFEHMINKHNAVKVNHGINCKGKGNCPKPTEVPDRTIWFETTNFGWILSPVTAGQCRKILYKE